MAERGSYDDVILKAPEATLSWSDLRVPGAFAKLVRELTKRDGRERDMERDSSAFVVLLDLDQKFIALTEVGGDNFFVSARRALRAAIRHDAANIVVGIPRYGSNPGPNNDDFAVSKALMDGSRALGLTLLDLVIAADEEYYSFRELGMLPGARGSCSTPS